MDMWDWIVIVLGLIIIVINVPINGWFNKANSVAYVLLAVGIIRSSWSIIRTVKLW